MADEHKRTNPFLQTESKHDVDIFAAPPKQSLPEATLKCEPSTDSRSSQSHLESPQQEKDPKTLFGFMQHGSSSSSTSATFKNPNIFGGKVVSPKQTSWRSSLMPDNHKSRAMGGTASTKDSERIDMFETSQEPSSDTVFRSQERDPKPSLFGGVSSMGSLPSGFSTAPSGFSTAPSGFSTAPSGFSTAPSGFSSAPSVFSSASSGYSTTASVFSTSSSAPSSSPSVFSSAHSGLSTTPSGFPSAPPSSSIGKLEKTRTQRPALVFGSKFSGRESSRSGISSSGLTSLRRDDSRSSLSPSSRRIRHLQSLDRKESDEEENSAPKESFFQTESSTLVAVEIPETYLDKSILYNHFTKFGSVKKVLINRNSNQASICFGDHKSAALAKAKGKKLHPLVPEMKLFFGAMPQPPKKKITLRKTPLDQIKSEFSAPKLDQIKSEFLPPKKVSPALRIADTARKEPFPVKSKAILPNKTEPRNKAPSGNLCSVTNFSVLMNSQANNNYDRFLILDARDKNIRAKQEKIMDVKKAHYLSATCPDMCPEKERYSRDIQYDISIYEMSNQKMDPKLVVKKFSRSSADKDEPLPHELRPGPVLKMTMDFLTCNIIAKGDDDDVQTDYWYNFLCNRTRALRNEIMQQHLQDSNAVYVLERCIRFHIHCSHQLCEENVENFDPKVNFEHLGKSLQSLKELYQDMGEKGVLFDTEAEFRGYEVLLNLSDGNIIFRYLKFRNPVRNSDYVQFAVKVLYAISSNNYSKFFKLLKEAGYLQACIMHKYFQSVRMKTLAAIMKAYISQSLPIEKIMNLLNFTTKSKCQAYLEPFGFDVTDDSKVHMDKVKFISKPSPLPPISRSEDITAKKRVPLGEIIQNGPLPSNPVYTYEPHDSFDPKGKLNPAAVRALDQASTRRQSKDGAKCELEETSKEILLEIEKKRLFKENVSKVDEMHRRKLVRNYLRTWRSNVKKQLELKRLKTQKTFVFVKLIAKVWRKKAAKTAELAKMADNHVKSKCLQRWISYVESRREMKDYLKRAEAIQKRLLMKKYVVKWKNHLNFKKSLQKAKVARRYLLSLKYFHKWKIYTKFSIAEQRSSSHYQLKLLRSCFEQWKTWYSMFGSRYKLDLSSFPASGSQFSLKEQNRMLDWGYDRDESLDMSAHQMLELNEAICTKTKSHYSLQQLSGLIAWSALPIIQRFQADVNSRPPDFSRNIFSRYFKIVILVEPGIDSYLLEWVRTKFNILEVDDLSSPLQCKVDFTAYHDGATYSIIVSEREFSLPYRVELDGASLVVFVASENKIAEVSAEIGNLDRTPRLIFCRSSSQDITGDEWRMTKRTIDDPFTSEKLFYLVLKFWQNRTQRVNLQKGRCNQVVTEFVSKMVLFPIYQVVSHRKLYGKLLPCPNEAVELYNSSILHARDCFSKCRSYQWPPRELLYLTTTQSKLWNNEDSKVVMSALKTALLPRFSVLPTPSWQKIDKQLTSFIKEVSGLAWNGNLHSEVRNILATFRSEAKDLHEDFDTHAPFHEIPWVDILNACIFFKLSLIPPIEIGYSHHDLYAPLTNEQRLYRLRSSEITHLPKEDTPAKRKVPFYLQLEPKKLKREEPHSLLLKEIQHEKELSFKYEDDLNKMVLLDNELEALFSQN